MEVLNRFIEACHRKPVILQDCPYPDYNYVTLLELLFVPVLLIAAFVVIVYWLLKNRDGHLPAAEMGGPPVLMVSEGGDFNPTEEEPLEEPPEEPWQYREDYPSPY